MKEKKRNLIMLAAGIIITFNSCSSGKREAIIGLNQNIHHDDFEYAVTGFSKTGMIISETDTLRAKGTFYLVHFRVMNKALRVGHQWDNSIGYIVDEKGNRFENIREGQVFLDRFLSFGFKENYSTQSGRTDSTILVFDLPSSIKQPYFMVRGGILMGDAFDGATFRKVKVRLF